MKSTAVLGLLLFSILMLETTHAAPAFPPLLCCRLHLPCCENGAGYAAVRPADNAITGPPVLENEAPRSTV